MVVEVVANEVPGSAETLVLWKQLYQRVQQPSGHLPVPPHPTSPVFNRERSVSSGSQCWHPAT